MVRCCTAVGFLLVFALTLSSCSDGGPAQGGGLLKGGLFGGSGKLVGRACPQVAILKAPSELIRFSESASRELSDILFQIKLELNGTTCEIEEKAVYVTGHASLSVERGPANIDGKAPFSFFVAVLNGKREIILRQNFPIVVEFKAGESRINFEDSVTLEIDKKPEVDASTYTIYAGLEMSPEELEFNRRRQR